MQLRSRKRLPPRWWRRNNAMKWIGVEPDRTEEYPEFEEVISRRGEKFKKPVRRKDSKAVKEG